MLIQILIFLVVLSVVVLVHELGHLLAAKKFGIKAEEFGIGLPPKVMKLFKKGETEYTLNLLPIGGFVRLYGENGESEVGVPDARAFWSKPIWQRGVVLLAGVTMNFLLAVVLFSIVYSFLGIPTQKGYVEIVGFSDNAPAIEAGFKEGDRVESVDGMELVTADAFSAEIQKKLGEEVDILVSRGDEEVEIKVTPRANPPGGEGALGVFINDSKLAFYPWWQMPFRGAVVGLKEAVAWGITLAGTMWMLIRQLLSGGGVPEGLAGPIGIAQITSEVSQAGIWPTLQFVGVLSVNLAILNVLPLPALDGGRVVFLIVEKIRGKRMKEEVEGWINAGGMILLLVLMALVTLNDLKRLEVFTKVKDLLMGIF